ncbi:GNAT family N-acetyltransferase [Variovorax defluvii]|uniref:GNAT family N-acetyltransferase n=1 Tax=Variovorax defluvii TaxID=913761 RepID=A0ABP8H3V5_9BURK
MSDYEVRPAVLRDAKAIAEVHAAAARAAYADVLPEDQLRALAPATREAKWREAIEYAEPQVHVAVLGEEVVGFVGFDRSRDPKTPSTTGEIWAIYVRPDHWGQGVGVALWDAAREGLEEEGCTVVTVWVPLRNDRALRFHELAGFKREMKTAKTTSLGDVRIEEIRLKRNV